MRSDTPNSAATLRVSRPADTIPVKGDRAYQMDGLGRRNPLVGHDEHTEKNIENQSDDREPDEPD